MTLPGTVVRACGRINERMLPMRERGNANLRRWIAAGQQRFCAAPGLAQHAPEEALCRSLVAPLLHRRVEFGTRSRTGAG